MRPLITFLCLLHVAPALAFAVVAFSCEFTLGHNTGLCAGDSLKPFLVLTACFWILLGVSTVLWRSHRRGVRLV